MTFPVLSANGPSGYKLTRSLRFRSSASAYLNRTPSTTGNRQIFTYSAWIKRGALDGNYHTLFRAGDAGTQFGIYFYPSNIIQIDNFGTVNTTAVFRDPSAWYHIVVSVDTTNATASNRVKIYVNNVNLATTVTVTQNTNTNANTSGVINSIGGNTYGTAWFDGYMAELNWVDGQQLTPSSFGSTNSTTGVWQPAKYTGTYGTNGFYLPFTNTTSTTTLGYDSSGNGNNWTTNNISLTAGSTYDSMTDVPTLTSSTAANFAVLNPLYTGRSTITNGNLTASGTTDLPTIIPDSGTYYFEIGGVSKTWTPPAAFPSAAGNYNFGQQPFTNTPTATLLNTYNLPASTVPNGAAYMAATLYTGTGASLTVANTVGSASFQPDMVWIKSRSATTDNKLTDVVRGVTKGLISNTTGAETTDTQGLTAFGSTGFTVGTNTDYNNSAATYVAWNWKAGGTGVTNTNGSITSTVSANTTSGFSVATFTMPVSGVSTVGHGLGVAPSLMILKGKSATGWPVYHVSTGNGGYTVLNTTAAFTTDANAWNNTSPTSSVFTIGTTFNNLGVYVAYCFAAIKGFSAFGSYTGNGSATDGPFIYTGFRPRYVLIKRTDASTGGDWFAYDTSRNPYNTANLILFSNLPDAEAASGGSSYLDILSNGFKARGNSNGINASAATYIYMAFAESPFQNALAR